MDANDPMRLYKSEKGYRTIMAWYDGLVESLPFDYESHYVETRFGKTHMLVAGQESAEPLILVQGVAGSAPLWRHQMSDLAQHFRVYALDIVGQPGRSAPTPPSFLDDGYSQWLIDVLDALHLSRAHFAGVSAGGWIVCKLAIYAPERVNKIVMLSPTGMARAKLPVDIWIRNVLNKKKDANALEDSLTTRSFSSPSPTEEFDRQLARAMALATRHYRVDLSVGIHDAKTGKIDFWKGLRVLRKFFLPEPARNLKRCTVPALLILGEHEMLYNARKASRYAQKRIPGLETAIISGAGHAAMYDQPEAVNPIIIDFLKR